MGFLAAAPRAPWVAVGIALIAAGGALHLWAKGCLHQNREVTTGGPYRFCRNPFYLANGLIDLGLCAVIGRWWIAAPYAFLWIRVYIETIEREEGQMAERFGVAFRAYRERVPRLLPLRRPLPASGASAFSWRNPNLAVGSEYARLVRIAVAPMAILLCARLRARAFGAAGPVFDGASLALLAAVGLLWTVKTVLIRRSRRSRMRVPAAR